MQMHNNKLAGRFVAAALLTLVVGPGCSPEYVRPTADCGACKHPDLGPPKDCGACKPGDCGACKPGDCGACKPGDCGTCKPKDCGTCPKCADSKVCPDGAPLPPAWPLQIGGPLADTATHVSVDNKDNVYVAGTFRGTAYVGPKAQGKVMTSRGVVDAYLAKVDKAGMVQWTLPVGTKFSDAFVNVVVDSAGNSYIAGTFHGQTLYVGTQKITYTKNNIYVAKVTSAGKVDWITSTGGNSVSTYDFAVNSKGVFLLGMFNKTATFGATNLTSTGSRAFLVQLHSSGSSFPLVKELVYPLTMDRVAVDELGNIYITGQFYKTVTVLGKTLVPTPSKVNPRDAFWLRLNSGGVANLVLPFGGDNHDEVLGIETDPSGNTYLSGKFRSYCNFGSSIKLISKGDFDLFVAKVDQSGNFIWAKSAGGSYFDDARGITMSSKPQLFIAGKFKHQASFGKTTLTAIKDKAVSVGSQDMFWAEVDIVSGAFKGAGSAGAPYRDYGNAITVDSAGAKFVAGTFEGKATFASASLASRGQTDGVIWRIP